MQGIVWNLNPTIAVNNLFFGTERAKIREQIGSSYKEFRKTFFSSGTTDSYPEVEVFYTESGNFDAIEVSGKIEIQLNGEILFPGSVCDAQKIITDLAYKSGSYISKSMSIGLYAPEGEHIESILMGSANYYERE